MTHAVGSELNAYLSKASAADSPRDAVHLRNQDLVIRTAAPGGWMATFEASIGDPVRGARSVDVLLRRGHEIAVMEIFDWFDDVGSATRSWDRKLAQVEGLALSRPQSDDSASRLRVAGCWVVRSTRRNRELVRAHPGVFRARFPGSGAVWLRALGDAAVAMPDQPALLWVSVNGERLWPARWWPRVDGLARRSPEVGAPESWRPFDGRYDARDGGWARRCPATRGRGGSTTPP